MKILYQDNEVVVVDTENENKAFPIRVFYEKKEYSCSYIEPVIRDLDKKTEVVKQSIIQEGKNKGIYLERIKELKYQIYVYEQSGSDATDRIQTLKQQINKMEAYQIGR